MLTVFGENYFLDLDAIEKYVQLPPNSQDVSGETENQLSVVKYEIVKLMLSVVMDGMEDFDETIMTSKSNGISPSYKIAFNTLLNKRLLTHY